MRIASVLALLVACSSGDRAAEDAPAGSELPVTLGETTLQDVITLRGAQIQEAVLGGRIHYYYGEYTFFFGSDSIAIGARIADARSRGESEQLFGEPQEEIRRSNHALWVRYRDSIGVLYDSAGQRSRFIEYMLQDHRIQPLQTDSTN